MALEQVANGETGLVVRGKINAGLTATDANTTAIATKANSSDMTTALAAKADASAMTTALAAKADASAVTTSLALKADLASPAFTGNPTATTQTAGNNTTRVATTAFVTTAVASASGSTVDRPAEALYNSNGAPGLAAKKLIADVRAGVSRRNLYIASDSTGMVGHPTTWPFVLRKILESSGLLCREDFWNLETGNLVRYGAAVAATGGFAPDYGMLKATAAGTIVFTPEKTCDSVTIVYFDNSTATFNVKVGAGSDTLVTKTNTGVMKKVTVTGPSGSTTATVTWVSGTVFIKGAATFDSAVKDLQIMNASVSGSTAYNQWDNLTGFNTGSTMKAWAPNFVQVSLGINDLNNSVSLANYTTALATIETNILAASGKVAWAGFHPISTVNDQQSFIDAILAKARAGSSPMISLWDRWGKSYSVANAGGMMGDTLHQSATACADTAAAVAKMYLD